MFLKIDNLVCCSSIGSTFKLKIYNVINTSLENVNEQKSSISFEKAFWKSNMSIRMQLNQINIISI